MSRLSKLIANAQLTQSLDGSLTETSKHSAIKRDFTKDKPPKVVERSEPSPNPETASSNVDDSTHEVDDEAADDNKFRLWLTKFEAEEKDLLHSLRLQSRFAKISPEGQSVQAWYAHNQAVLLATAEECPRGKQYGRKMLYRYSGALNDPQEGMSESYTRYQEAKERGEIASLESEDGNGGLELSTQPLRDSPLSHLMARKKLSLYDSAPGSRWQGRLSAQRNSGFGGGVRTGLRRDAAMKIDVSGMIGGGMGRVEVPVGLRQAVARNVAMDGTVRDESDDELDNFSADEEDDDVESEEPVGENHGDKKLNGEKEEIDGESDPSDIGGPCVLRRVVSLESAEGTVVLRFKA